MELWRRTIPGIQFLPGENGQRNNAESIEIGLPRARLRSVCSRCSSVVCRRAARMPRPGWTRIFPERRISKSSDHLYIRLHTLFPTFPLPAFRPRDSPRSAGSIPRVDSIFLFFTVSTMSFLVLFLSPPSLTLPSNSRDSSSCSMRRAAAQGCEELLTFHCEHWVLRFLSQGEVRPRNGSCLFLVFSLYPFRSFFGEKKDNSIQSE